MSKQQKETVTMALLMLFFCMILLLLLLFCRYRIFFLAFVNKQNFKRFRDIHLSGRKRRRQPRLYFLGHLISLEGGIFRQIILF